MSHVVRYTLACLILSAGILGAWKYRVSADETKGTQEPLSISQLANAILEKVTNEPRQTISLAKQEPQQIFNQEQEEGPVDPFLDLESTVIPASGELPQVAQDQIDGGNAPRWVAREPTDAPKIDRSVPIWQASHGSVGVSAHSDTPVSNSQASPTSDQPERGFVPARRSHYLPRAFQRQVDGPSAELPRVNRALR